MLEKEPRGSDGERAKKSTSPKRKEGTEGQRIPVVARHTRKLKRRARRIARRGKSV